MTYQFNRTRIDKIPRHKLIGELEKVAEKFHYVEFGWRNFDSISNISAGTIKREFGTWRAAITALRDHLKSKNIVLSPRNEPYNRIHSDKEMFTEMERIWKAVGHRPSRPEWEGLSPRIHYNTYKKRFNGWKNACLKFIENQMGQDIILTEVTENNATEELQNGVEITIKNLRTISLKLRLQVLSRDNFRCKFCGKSPATELGVKLHIDHIIPFSKGGKSIAGNLQTLCFECNLGKGNDESFSNGILPTNLAK